MPDDLPISEPVSSDYHYWKIKTSAQLKGGDLNREFEIPVYANSQVSQADLTLTTDHWPKAALKISLTSILPMVSGTQEREIYYSYFKHPFQSLFGFIFGIFFVGIGVYIWNLSDDLGLIFMSGAFFLIGGFVAFFCLLGAISSSRIRFDGRILSSESKILGVMASKKQMSYDQIRSVSVKGGINSKSGGDENSFNYTLEAVGSKQTITLVTDIRSTREKDFLLKHFEHEFFGSDAELVLA